MKLKEKYRNSDANFNQIDKRPVDTYKSMWNLDDELTTWLKLFSGEIKPSDSKILERKQYRIMEKDYSLMSFLNV